MLTNDPVNHKILDIINGNTILINDSRMLITLMYALSFDNFIVTMGDRKFKLWILEDVNQLSYKTLDIYIFSSLILTS